MFVVQPFLVFGVLYLFFVFISDLHTEVCGHEACNAFSACNAVEGRVMVRGEDCGLGGIYWNYS